MWNVRDPPWFNDKIKLLIIGQIAGHKYFRQNGINVYQYLGERTLSMQEEGPEGFPNF